MGGEQEEAASVFFCHRQEGDLIQLLKPREVLVVGSVARVHWFDSSYQGIIIFFLETCLINLLFVSPLRKRALAKKLPNFRSS